LPRRQVISEVEKRRAKKGVNMPTAFEQTVQAAFQAYAGEYAAFKDRHAPPSDDLFFAARTPKGSKGVWWAIRRDKADAWMLAKKKGISAT